MTKSSTIDTKKYFLEAGSVTEFNNLYNFLKNSTVKDSEFLDSADTAASLFFKSLLEKYYKEGLNKDDITNLLIFLKSYNQVVNQEFYKYSLKKVFGIEKQISENSIFNNLKKKYDKFILNSISKYKEYREDNSVFIDILETEYDPTNFVIFAGIFLFYRNKFPLELLLDVFKEIKIVKTPVNENLGNQYFIYEIEFKISDVKESVYFEYKTTINVIDKNIPPKTDKDYLDCIESLAEDALGYFNGSGKFIDGNYVENAITDNSLNQLLFNELFYQGREGKASSCERIYNIVLKKEEILCIFNKPRSKGNFKNSVSDLEMLWTSNNAPISFIDLKNIPLGDLTSVENFLSKTGLDSSYISNYCFNVNTSGNGDYYTDITILYKELNPLYREILNSESIELTFQLLYESNPSSVITYGEETNLSKNIPDSIRELKDNESEIFIEGSYTELFYKYFYGNPYRARILPESSIISYYYGDNYISNGYGKRMYQIEEIKRFLYTYNLIREYYYFVLLNESFIHDSDYKVYEKFFLGVCAIERTISGKIDTLKDIDSFDDNDVVNFLETYGLSVLSERLKTNNFIGNEKYSRRILKFYNELMKNKGSKKVVDMLIEIFDFGDTEIDIRKFILAQKNSSTDESIESFSDGNTIRISNVNTSLSNFFSFNGHFVSWSEAISNKDFFVRNSGNNYTFTLKNGVTYPGNVKRFSEIKFHRMSLSNVAENNDYIFIEIPYTSDNVTKDMLTEISSATAYQSFIADDIYWNEGNVPTDDLDKLNINTSNTKYTSLSLKENFIKTYVLSRYLLSITKYFGILEIDNNKVLKPGIFRELIMESNEIGEVSLYDAVEAIGILFETLLDLYSQQMAYNSNSNKFDALSYENVGEGERFFGLNKEYLDSVSLSSLYGNDNIFYHICKSINYGSIDKNINENINDFIRSYFLISQQDFSYSTDNITNDEKIFGYAGYFRKNNNFDEIFTLQDSNKQKKMFNFIGEKAFADFKVTDTNLENNNSGVYIETFLFAISLLLMRYRFKGENFEGNPFYIKNIRKVLERCFVNESEMLDYKPFYNFYEILLDLPRRYMDDILYSAEYDLDYNNKYNNKEFRDCLEVLFNKYYTTSKNPMKSEKDGDNFVLNLNPESPLIKYVFESTEIGKDVFEKSGTNRYSVKEIPMSSIDLYITGISDTLINLCDTIHDSFVTDAMQFSLSFAKDEENELGFLRATVEIFLSYTVMLKESRYIKTYNTKHESIPFAELVNNFEVKTNITDFIYYDDELRITKHKESENNG